MQNRWATVFLVGAVCTSGAAIAFAQRSSEQPFSPDTSVARFAQYHHTDQGTRLLPAAWLAVLKTSDGSDLVMSRANTAKFGFIPSDGSSKQLNPYDWPIGWTISDPKENNGVVVAGVTCAACHTGQIEFGGRSIRIEGGQAMTDLPAFDGEVLGALGATASDPVRKAQFFKDAIAAGYPADRMEADFNRFATVNAAMLKGQAALVAALPGPGRVDAIQGIADALLRHDINEPSNLRSYDAPVSYPYLWDIWRLSWLQYNGFMPWPHALSRNIGEVLGTSGRTNLVDAGGALTPEPQRWRTSIQMANLLKMEATIQQMKAPVWPAQVLGAVNSSRATQGRKLFAANCAGCHGIKELPNGAWDVAVIPLQQIGTDANQATNWAGRTYNGSKLGLGPAVHASAAANIVNAVRNQWYTDNQVPAAKRESDVTFGAACGYKARPLIGAWATPPFLHNGSVRTVYDLLSDTRPSTFGVGTRVYDPARLGYVNDTRPNAYKFDATANGNSNAGHWWTDDEERPGRIGRKFSEPEKLAIIEYLKAATYANYPRMRVATQQALPCANQPQWATKSVK